MVCGIGETAITTAPPRPSTNSFICPRATCVPFHVSPRPSTCHPSSVHVSPPRPRVTDVHHAAAHSRKQSYAALVTSLDKECARCYTQQWPQARYAPRYTPRYTPSSTRSRPKYLIRVHEGLIKRFDRRRIRERRSLSSRPKWRSRSKSFTTTTRRSRRPHLSPHPWSRPRITA